VTVIPPTREFAFALIVSFDMNCCREKEKKLSMVPRRSDREIQSISDSGRISLIRIQQTFL
jgi:hypothetical protein